MLKQKAPYFKRSGAVLLAIAFLGNAYSQMPPTQGGGVTPVPGGPPPTSQATKVLPAIGKGETAQLPFALSQSLSNVDQRLTRGPIDLQTAISISLSNSPQLALAAQNLLFARGRLGETRSALLPIISATPGENYVKRLATEGYGIQATLPIDISRLLTAATEQAGFQEVAARLEVNRVRNEVIYGVQHAFYAALRSQALVKVSIENLQDSLDRLADAQARYKAQAVAYIDVVRAQTDVADAQKQVIQARSAVSNAIANLSNSMGINVMSSLEITDSGAVLQPPGNEKTGLKDPKDSLVSELSAGATDAMTLKGLSLGPQFQSVLDEALRTRPELLQSEAYISAAKKGLLIARRSSLPSLAIGIGYFDFRNQTGTQINEPQAFIGFSVPLYDGGLTHARDQEARATVSEAVTSKRVQIDNVSLDVQRAYLALVQARDQVAVANQAVVQARAAFDLARVRYNAGVASRAGLSPLLEVSDAQAALTLAEQNQVNALYDFNDARAQVDRSAGRFAYVGNGPGFPAVPSSNVVGK